jgi:hypothetical protein
VKLRIVLAVALASSLSLADAEPSARPGNGWVPYQLEVDQSALPEGRVLAYSRPAKWRHDIYEDGVVELLVSPLKGEKTIFLFVVSRAEADGKHTVRDVRQKGATPLRYSIPEAGQLPLGDRRDHVVRRTRVKSVEPLQIEDVEDVFESESGEVICRVPPLEGGIEDGVDPCVVKKKSRTELMAIFVRENQVWLASGLVGTLLVTGAAWIVVRRRKKPAS